MRRSTEGKGRDTNETAGLGATRAMRVLPWRTSLSPGVSAAIKREAIFAAPNERVRLGVREVRLAFPAPEPVPLAHPTISPFSGVQASPSPWWPSYSELAHSTGKRG